MIGIAIVTYNSAEVIGRCLKSCKPYRVVVVDNASTDDTVRVARSQPGVVVVANAQNRGFAAAMNQAVRALGTEIVVALNPDAVLETALEGMAAALGDAGVGAAGGQLLDEHGEAQDGFNVRAFPTPMLLAFEALGVNALWPGNPVNSRYRRRVRSAVTIEVDQPAGAFLAFRRNVWEAIGGFDEGFWPIWFEDVDFCRRVKDQGLRILYIPAVRARHLGGHSAKGISWQERQLHWYRSLLRYAAKHFSPWGRVVVCTGVVQGSCLRAVAGLVLKPSEGPVGVYSRVVWAAVRTLLRGASDARGGPGRVEAALEGVTPRLAGSTEADKKAITRPV